MRDEGGEFGDCGCGAGEVEETGCEEGVAELSEEVGMGRAEGDCGDGGEGGRGGGRHYGLLEIKICLLN